MKFNTIWTTDSVIAAIESALQQNPGIFPTAKNIVSLPGCPGARIVGALPPKKLAEWQVQWIKDASVDQFLAAYHDRLMQNVSPTVSAAADTKFILVAESVVEKHPEHFPNPQQFNLVDNLPGTFALGDRIPQSKWEEWQMRWIQTAAPKHFFSVLSNNYASAVSAPLEVMINRRLTSIVGDMLSKRQFLPPILIVLDKHPDFPSLRILSRIENTVWEEWQTDWIKKADPAYLLKAVREKHLNQVSDKVRLEITKRLPDLLELAILNHPELFPCPSAFATVDGLPTKKTLTKAIPLTRWEKWQIEWIRTSSDEHFIANLISARLRGGSPLIEREKTARIRKILVERLTAMPVEEAISFCGRTLRSNVPDLDQILGIVSGITQKSPDQEIISMIGLDSTKREPWVNQLIEKRLEQLWFFRELLVLAKLHRADFASIVSFTSPSLPERLNALLPEVVTDHILLEEMEKGPRTLEDRVILLSVLQWLSPERVANLINNVSASTKDGAEVIFTYPPTHLIDPRAVEILRQAGFALEQVGQLCLSPVGIEGAEAAKLEQVSNVAILRRLATSAEMPRLDLFLRPEAFMHIPEGQVAVGSTYSAQVLQAATPSMVLHEPTAVLVSGNKPILFGVELGTNGNGMLFLGDGKFTVLAGFNLHPGREGLAEVEGRTVTQPILDAVSAIATGKPAAIHVPTDLADKYASFLQAVRTSGDLTARQVRGRIRA